MPKPEADICCLRACVQLSQRPNDLELRLFPMVLLRIIEGAGGTSFWRSGHFGGCDIT